VGILV
jgi:thioredoxin reductase (NADPH)